jgi:hypothetical protein
VFYPLGTAAPLIVKAKIRLRALGLKASSWTEAVDEADQKWGTAWFEVVRKLSASMCGTVIVTGGLAYIKSRLVIR